MKQDRPESDWLDTSAMQPRRAATIDSLLFAIGAVFLTVSVALTLW